MLCDVMRRYVAIQWIGVFWVKPWSHNWLVKALSQMPRPSDIHPCIQLVGWHEVELHDQMVACKDHVVAHPRGWTIRRIPGQRIGHLHWMLHVTCPHSPWMIRPKRGATWRNMVQCRSPWNIWNIWRYMKHMKQRRSSFLRTECEVAKRLRNILKLRGRFGAKKKCSASMAKLLLIVEGSDFCELLLKSRWVSHIASLQDVDEGVRRPVPEVQMWLVWAQGLRGSRTSNLEVHLWPVSDQNSDLINPYKSVFSKSDKAAEYRRLCYLQIYQGASSG